MLKFLLYLFLIYLAYKLYRAITSARVIVKNYHYHDNRRSHREEKEGTMHIKENPAKKAGSSNNSLDDAGEYIDFEEVKD